MNFKIPLKSFGLIKIKLADVLIGRIAGLARPSVRPSVSLVWAANSNKA